LKVTKKGQPLTAMGRAKLRKLRARGRARNWHLSRKNLRAQNRAELVLEAEREWRRKPLAERQAWFESEVFKTLNDAFSPENLRAAAGPLATLGTPTIKVRRI
jgi:hypothetical protein